MGVVVVVVVARGEEGGGRREGTGLEPRQLQHAASGSICYVRGAQQAKKCLKFKKFLQKGCDYN